MSHPVGMTVYFHDWQLDLHTRIHLLLFSLRLLLAFLLLAILLLAFLSLVTFLLPIQ
jgi:hypothetical protein